MTRTAIIIPTATNGDKDRENALEFVLAKLEKKAPRAKVVLGELEEETPWSKGRAVHAGLEQLDDVPDVLVIHDADSFIVGDQLGEAIDIVAKDPTIWVTPHKMVYRLREKETARLIANPHAVPRRIVHRSPYVGPAGGGITVLSPKMFVEVGGIDPRFEGWGGEDLAFAWALETLGGGTHERLAGHLFHLWHEHPAPELRGSEESEELVAQYRGARGFPRRMRALVDEGEWEPAEPLEEAVRFRMTANRKTLRIAGHDPLRFRNGIYETTDPDEVEALERHPYVIETKAR